MVKYLQNWLDWQGVLHLPYPESTPGSLIQLPLHVPRCSWPCLKGLPVIDLEALAWWLCASKEQRGPSVQLHGVTDQAGH
jgi:hypothetical protein